MNEFKVGDIVMLEDRELLYDIQIIHYCQFDVLYKVTAVVACYDGEKRIRFEGQKDPMWNFDMRNFRLITHEQDQEFLKVMREHDRKIEL
jgi:hypothetical protein